MIDTHAHLTDERYENLNEIVNNYLQSGIKTVISAGYDLKSSEGSERLSKIYPSVYFTAGVNPSGCNEINAESLKFLENLAKSDKCAGIGEIGLDYHYEDYDKDSQKKAFIKQIELADKLKLPVIIHSRDCEQDMQDLLAVNKSLLKKGGVMHCYSGSKESLKFYLDLGFYISFAGPVTFKNNVKSAEIIKYAPMDRILCETDSPYLTPEPFRGRLNEPANVIYVIKFIAAVKGLDENETAKMIFNNALCALRFEY